MIENCYDHFDRADLTLEPEIMLTQIRKDLDVRVANLLYSRLNLHCDGLESYDDLVHKQQHQSKFQLKQTKSITQIEYELDEYKSSSFLDLADIPSGFFSLHSPGLIWDKFSWSDIREFTVTSQV